MSKFLDTSGNSTYGIALCARCSKKFALKDLVDDPNIPGLKVCRDDADNYDPYRLPQAQTDNIVLPFVRPDASVATNPSGVITQDGTQFVVSEDGQRFLFIID
jgi:hypothetical protein